MLIDVNGAYLNLLGYRRQALIGLPLYRFVAGPSRASRSGMGLSAGGRRVDRRRGIDLR